MAAERQCDAATSRDLDGVLDGLGKIGEESRHFGGRLQVLLLAVPTRPPRVVERASLLNADPPLVRLELLALEETRIVRRDHRQTEARRELDDGHEMRRFARTLGSRHFEVEAIGKRVAARTRDALRALHVAPRQCAADRAVDATAEHNESIAPCDARPDVGDEAEWLFPSRERWAQEVQLHPVLIEAPVYYAGEGCQPYAGTMDLLGWVRGQLRLLDWKSSNDFFGEMDLQNVAYRRALQYMLGEPAVAVGGLLVRFPKDSGARFAFEEGQVPEDCAFTDEQLWQVFTALRTVKPWQDQVQAEGLERWKRRKAQQAATSGVAPTAGLTA